MILQSKMGSEVSEGSSRAKTYLGLNSWAPATFDWPSEVTFYSVIQEKYAGTHYSDSLIYLLM